MVAPIGVGVGWSNQVRPFQCWAIGDGDELPTAMQAAIDMQETAFRLPIAWTDAGWIDQRLPFQRSASVTSLPAMTGCSWVPTAMQADGDRHDTPVSLRSISPVGFGLGWIVHRSPSQRSARAA